MAGESTPPAKAEAPGAPPAAEEKIPRIVDDPLLGALADDLSIVIAAERQKDDGTPAEAPPVIKPAEETPPPAPKVTTKQRQDPRAIAEDVFAKKMEELNRSGQAPPLPPKTAEALPPKKEEAVAPSAGEAMSPEQTEEIADAEYAEKFDPKFKGLKDKLTGFYKKMDVWVKEHEGDSDRTFDENDPQFMEFLGKNKPDWSGSRERVRIERIADARAEVKMAERDKAQSGRLEKAERDALEARVRPQIDKQVGTFETELAAETKSEDPLEAEVFESFRQSASQLATDYLRLIHGVDRIADPAKEPDLFQRHNYLMQFVSTQAEIFDRKGGDAKVRDGKMFITPGKWMELQQSGKSVSNNWTLTSNDVLRMLRVQAINDAKTVIKTEEERAVKRGFARVKVTPAPKQAEGLPQSSGTRVLPSAAPGAVDGTATQQLTELQREILDTLELKK